MNTLMMVLLRPGEVVQEDQCVDVICQKKKARPERAVGKAMVAKNNITYDVFGGCPKFYPKQLVFA